MTGSCIIGILGLYEVSNFLGAFNTLSYSDVSDLDYFLWCVKSDDFNFSYGLILYLSLGIVFTGSFSSGLYFGSDVGYCLTLYMKPNILHANRGTSSGFMLGMSFSILPTQHIFSL